MKKILIFLLLTTTLLANYNGLNLEQENKVTIKTALSLHFSGMNRKSLSQKDVIEEMLVKGLWKMPEENQTIKSGQGQYEWKKIEAAENGWFDDKSLNSGYAYVKIESDIEKIMILEGMAYSMVYVNGEPRQGNVYKFSSVKEDWEPEFGFSYLPIKLKKGTNEFLFQCYYGKMKATLYEPKSNAIINTIDNTLPDILVEESPNKFGAFVLINASESERRNLSIKTYGEGFVPTITKVPSIMPLSVRKVRFNLGGKYFTEAGTKNLQIEILENEENIIDKNEIEIKVLDKGKTHRRTFISSIDGSVQYYAVNPPKNYKGGKTALFFALHGAAVEGYNHAASYYPKTWGRFVSPTNRRPYGFNWEDWGRLDALEILEIAKEKYDIDENRVYLTGHSMGGHGTWHIGATFPDQFAAIGPSAGWISFWSYRYLNAEKSKSKVKQLIDRTGNPSDTYTLAKNYEQLGIYVIHGSDDDNVRATQSHNMIDTLKTFHKDFVYYEQPGAGHWWDYSDAPGADCVDWPYLFDFFARHARPTKKRINHIKFVTASPGVSSTNNWAQIYLQEKFFDFSKIDLLLEKGVQRIKGTTKNVSILTLDCSVLDKEQNLTVILDEQKIENISIASEEKIWLQKTNNKWQLTRKPNLSSKNPNRYGSFKDVFKNNMIFVYGTNGTEEENVWAKNKVRYDAEQFWYQGNGSIEIIADKDFDTMKFKDCNIILYGNSKTNLAWEKLLAEAPIKVDGEKIICGNKKITGKDLLLFMIYPKNNSSKTCVGVIAGTGIEGMKLADKRPYLKPGFTYPDFVIMDSSILEDNDNGYKAAGFFDANWLLEKGEIAVTD